MNRALVVLVASTVAVVAAVIVRLAPVSEAPGDPQTAPASIAVTATAASGRQVWSEAKSWLRGAPPSPGAAVVIPAGVEMLLDVSPPELASIEVSGALVFDRRDLRLRTGSLVVYGRLEIGTEAAPFLQEASVTLTGRRPTGPEDAAARGLLVLGGSIDLHGKPRERAWVRLAEPAEVAARSIVLAAPVDWLAGERVVIAPSGFDPEEAEEVVITGVDGARLSIDRPLKYRHRGEVIENEEGTEVPAYAEVGLLSRNLRIEGDMASLSSGIGGHLMVHQGALARLSWVQFERMGQAGMLARYPVHFHLAGDVTGSYVSGVSISHSFNRCLTIHGSSNLRVTGNVAYDTRGHCFFFEDGAETGNHLEGNLGLLTRVPAPDMQLLASDSRPATFWVSHPNNTLVNNVAAGSAAFGFWYDPPAKPTGLSKTPETERTVFPRRNPLGIFAGNTAHSNRDSGLTVGDFSDENLVVYTPRAEPIVGATVGTESAVIADFQGLIAYSNEVRDAWLLGDSMLLSGARLSKPSSDLAGIRSLAHSQRIEMAPYLLDGRYRWGPTYFRGVANQTLKVTVRNETEMTHNFTLGAYGLDFGPGEIITIDLTFPESGSLVFVCKYHPSMQGELLTGDARHTIEYVDGSGGFPGYFNPTRGP